MLITGTSRGVGRFLAEYYADRGYNVAGISRADSPAPSRFTQWTCDVTVEDEVTDVMHMIRDAWGRLDVLINNAGIASMNHSLLTPPDTLRRILDVNAVGTFMVSQGAARLMRATRAGRIVNLSSVAVPLALEGEAAYAASKAAIEMLTRVMARELSPFNITVNAVGPGPMDTNLMRGIPDEKWAAIIDQTYTRRRHGMADVANVIDFFINPKSRAITGQVVYVGGA